MSCDHCGGAVPEGASFCPTCGTPVGRAGDAETRRPGRYEICEIRYWHGYLTSHFYAVAMRPDGSSYEVERSPTFHWRHRGEPAQGPRPLAAHSLLVARLVEDGWQLLHDKVVAHAGEWYALRFRRRLAPTLTEAVAGVDDEPDDARRE